MSKADAFALVVGARDLGDRLDEAALAVADARPGGADRTAASAELDRLAESCREPSMSGVVDALARAGFRGDRRSYHRSDNSLLDRVLERRLGIPITLSIAAIAVGRRLGLPVVGVGMPSHFLIGSPDGERFADPFNGVSRLDAAACARLFTEVIAPGAPFRSEFIQPTPPVQILRRLLNNLIASFGRVGSRSDLVWTTELATRLPDVTPDDLRAHAEALAAAGQFDRAAATIEQLDPTRPADIERVTALRARLN